MSTREALAVAVAVVSFETRDLLQRCLASVRADQPVEIVVVDNGSTDGSSELVSDEFPDARLVVNRSNRGYGAAANQALAACESPAALLLNSDTELERGALLALGRYLAEHPAAGVVGPRLADPDGRLQPSTLSYPSVADMLMGDTGLHRVVRRIPGLRERFLRTWAHDAARVVPWVSGAALAMRRSAFEAVGGFDERYFMYWEEVDLCRRMAAAGFQTHYTPVTTVVHARSASTSKQAAVMQREWLLSYGRFLATHETPRSAAAQLGLLRALTHARATRARMGRLTTRDRERRRLLTASVAEWDALLHERGLWNL